MYSIDFTCLLVERLALTPTFTPTNCVNVCDFMRTLASMSHLVGWPVVIGNLLAALS
jgi:hypothetical protein